MDPKHNCSDNTGHRAWLTCNGQPFTAWAALGDCKYAALGCRMDGCRPRWSTASEQKWAILTTNYRVDFCNGLRPPLAPPHPPPSPPPPPPFWCEQRLTAGTALDEAQPANVFTSLFAVGFAMYGLFDARRRATLSYFRAVCYLLALTGIGSAYHHMRPHAPLSHAADWVPMLGLCACSMVHAAHVLAARLVRSAFVLRPRDLSTVQDGILLFGLFFGTLCAVGYSGDGHILEVGGIAIRHFLLIVGVAGTVIGNAAIFCLIAREAYWDCDPRERHELYFVLRAYVASAIVAMIAFAAQRVEHGGCSDGLFRAYPFWLHPLWHAGIFYSLYLCTSLLQHLEAAGSMSRKSPCDCAPWLLFRMVGDKDSTGHRDIALAQPPDAETRMSSHAEDHADDDAGDEPRCAPARPRSASAPIACYTSSTTSSTHTHLPPLHPPSRDLGSNAIDAIGSARHV